MAEKPPKRPLDLNQWAKRMVDVATGEAQEAPAKHAGKAQGGAKGGAARASRMTDAERTEAARLAAQARWRRKTD